MTLVTKRWLGDRVAELESANADLQAQLDRAFDRIEDLEAEVREAERDLRQVERELEAARG